MTAARRGRPSAFGVLIALVGAFLLYMAIPNAGMAIRAARAHEGVPGTFTANRMSCVQHPGHRACNWQGEFRSDDGTMNRGPVYLYGGNGGVHKVGEQLKARDIGRPGQVYGLHGSHEWILTALLFLAGVALLFMAGVHRIPGSVFSRLITRPSSPRPNSPRPSSPRQNSPRPNGPRQNSPQPNGPRQNSRETRPVPYSPSRR